VFERERVTHPPTMSQRLSTREMSLAGRILYSFDDIDSCRAAPREPERRARREAKRQGLRQRLAGRTTSGIGDRRADARAVTTQMREWVKCQPV